MGALECGGLTGAELLCTGLVDAGTGGEHVDDGPGVHSKFI